MKRVKARKYPCLLNSCTQIHIIKESIVALEDAQGAMPTREVPLLLPCLTFELKKKSKPDIKQLVAQWWLTWWSTAFTNCIVSPHQHSNSHVLNTCQVSLCDMLYVSTKLLWTLTNSKITSEMGEMFSKMCLKSGAFSLPCTGEFWCSWLAFDKLNTWVLWLSKHLLCGISACFPVRWTYATSNTEGIFSITNCKCPYRMQYSTMRLKSCLLCSLNTSYSPQRT